MIARSTTRRARLLAARSTANAPQCIASQICLSIKSFTAHDFSTEAKSPYKYGVHRSNAEELIAKIPVIEVDGHVATCDGGSGGLGHPVEYITLDTVSSEPAVCKYCGLRFVHKSHNHHH